MAKRTTRSSKSEDKPGDLQENAALEETAVEAPATDEVKPSEDVSAQEAVEAAEPVSEPTESETLENDAAETTATDVESVTETSAEDHSETIDTAEPEESAEPEAEPPAEPTPEPVAAPQQVVVKKGGFGSALIGGVVAAVIGAGAAIYALPQLPPSMIEKLGLAGSTQDAERLAALEAKLDAEAKKIDALGEDLASLKSVQPPAPDLSGVQTALDQISAEVRGNKSAVEDLKTQIAGMVQGDNGAAQAGIEAAAKAAEERIKQAEEQAQALKAQSEAAAKATMTQAAAARVKAALDAGAPLDSPLADLRAAGIAVPAALSGDIPTLQSLQASFPDAARAALDAARRAEAGTSLGDRAGAFLMSQIGARSVAPKEGDGADAVLSRAQADVDAGQIAAALDEIGKLPEPAQAPLADWVSKAQARVAALDAANQLGAAQ
ncbi:hypothetical protein BMI90_04765 [Thioclava sp. L04-15]|uniref:COG4223 family protein n=1 Tax=Thioclava sp. L04-15 TaxID=1915318 RepID=UPI000998BDB2|nr:hypothetical protein [Thioclava sp. L04-15]OOY29553.1 hypothetical protein BMI90_04765 [Thioclava sp. L04-15]TNE85853.1 MAG: hypothetical protein EP337_12435 [Paracoccaceae bacterium]